MSRRFFITAFALVAITATVVADDLEIRDLDVTNWPCLNEPSGTAKTQDGIERDTMKNRSAIDLTAVKIESLDTAGYRVAQR